MHRKIKEKEIKTIFGVITALFALFLLYPMLLVLARAFGSDGGALESFKNVFTAPDFAQALLNSFTTAATSGIITVIIAFILAYAVNNTNLHPKIKRAIEIVTVFPMLLPTITYGFAIMYSFGKEGLLTQLLGFQLFDIYGFRGMVLGFVIYTLPVAFLLINNTFKYIDKRYIVVSRVMGDNKFRTFMITCVRPMIGTLGAAFVQSFFLSFTDFGIPEAIGGEFEVVSAKLYNEMLGSVPNFNNGAVIALVMLVPSVISILLLNFLERYNFRYNRITESELEKNPVRDGVFFILSAVILLAVLSVFLVIFIIPFVDMWPYRIEFTLDHIKELFSNSELSRAYTNSLITALFTALFGTLTAYAAALVTSRSKLSGRLKQVIETIALVINTIPGMVLGIAFMFAFSATPLQNTLFIMVVCNIIHFFSTPYLMMKNSLSKMNESWETTAMLMGDSWMKTIIRVVTPNAGYTIVEVFSYYFINAMVTISAVIFIAGARTMVITTKIKELQHFAEFDKIFALSLLLLATNLVAKGIFAFISSRKK